MRPSAQSVIRSERLSIRYWNTALVSGRRRHAWNASLLRSILHRLHLLEEVCQFHFVLGELWARLSGLALSHRLDRVSHRLDGLSLALHRLRRGLVCFSQGQGNGSFLQRIGR